MLWSRYLGLFVGHGAYAQILVLAVYLGGMAVGSLAVSDVSRRLRRLVARVEIPRQYFALRPLLGEE